MPKAYYFDTSIIRPYLFGHTAIRNHLTNKLKSKIKITSKYVKMEFYRGFLQNILSFYFVLNDRQNYSIKDAVLWWNETFAPRELKDLNYVINDIFKNINDQNDKEQALFNLRNEIVRILIIFKHIFSRYENNNANCFLGNFDLDFSKCSAREDYEEVFYEFLHKIKNNCVANCAINNFLLTSKSVIEKIKVFNSKNNGFLTQKKNLSGLVGYSIKSCDDCCRFGDTIIALECPNYAILIAQDQAFEDLCKIMNIKCEIIDSLRKTISSKSIFDLLKYKN